MSEFFNHPAAMPVILALCAFAYWADKDITNQFQDSVADSHFVSTK